MMRRCIFLLLLALVGICLFPSPVYSPETIRYGHPVYDWAFPLSRPRGVPATLPPVFCPLAIYFGVL